MLRAEDAKRIDSVPREKGYQQKVYIFDCVCGKEMRVQRQRLARHGGRCVKCSKRKRHKYQTLYNSMRSSVGRANARFRRKVEFLLTFEDFLEFTEVSICRYCGGGVHWQEWGPGPYNLDRLDNSNGYEKSNLAVCCFSCNHQKGNFYSGEEFSAVCDFLRVWRRIDEHERRELLYTIIAWDQDWMVV